MSNKNKKTISNLEKEIVHLKYEIKILAERYSRSLSLIDHLRGKLPPQDLIKEFFECQYDSKIGLIPNIKHLMEHSSIDLKKAKELIESHIND